MSPRLSFERRGEGRRIVLVHGFTQSAGSWRPVVDPLARENEVLAVDAPNHGGSAQTTAAGLGEAARLVTEVGVRAAYVGYSMGGRICLRAALDRPALVQALVLVGATAGIVDRAERAARRLADLQLADRLSSQPLEEFLDEWLAGPLFSTLDRTAADLESRLVNTRAGLARSLRTVGTGSMAPLWDRLPELAMPVLVVAGEHDPKFAELGRRLAAAIGSNATLHLLAGAGHAVPFEKPVEFTTVLRDFLKRPDRS